MYPFVGILVSGWMSEDRFEVVVHHCGHFVSDGKLRYDGGERVSWFCDPDTWSYFEILHEVRELGHLNPKELWYSVGGESVLEDRLVQLVDDKGTMHMATVKEDVQEVHAEVEENLHETDEVEVVEVYDETEDKSDADGEDTRSDVAAKQFCDEGLVDVSVEADEEVKPWDGHMECEVGYTPEDMEEQVLTVNHSVVIQVRMRL